MHSGDINNCSIELKWDGKITKIWYEKTQAGKQQQRLRDLDAVDKITKIYEKTQAGKQQQRLKRPGRSW